MWNGPPISNIPPAHQVGNEILQQLLLLPQVLPRKPIDASTAIILGKSARSGPAPSLSMVMEDLVLAKDLVAIDFKTQTFLTGVSNSDILSAMILSMSSEDWISQRNLYGVFDILATPRGISLCRFDLDDPGSINTERWSTAWTPPGGVSHAHMEFYGSSQQLYFFDGECEEAWVLKPNVIHACLSLTTSMHLGTRFWSYDHSHESFQIMRWIVAWLTDYRTHHVLTEDARKELHTVHQELAAWKRLVKEFPQDPRARAVREQVASIQKDVDALERILRVYEEEVVDSNTGPRKKRKGHS